MGASISESAQSREAVTHPTHRFNHGAGFAQGLAQALDVHIHRSLFNEDLIAPNPIEQARTRVHPLGVVHQIAQQLELGGAEFEGFALPAHTVRGSVEAELAHRNAVRGRGRRPSAHHGSNPGEQLLR